MAPTLRDVARQAGVSVATASRVAAGSAGVRPETRLRVERAMRKVLYVPPRREAPSGAIGLILPDLGNPVFPALAQAMEARASALGFATILCNARGSSLREADYVHMLLERNVEGMIFISSEAADDLGDHSHYPRLRKEGARLVFVNGSLPSVPAPAVGVDERAAGELATRHLIELGHEAIAFVAGPRHYRPTRDKNAGREATLRAAGLDGSSLVAYADFGVEGGRDAFRELMRRTPQPTAVICSSDVMAVGVLQEAAAAGLRVPEDLSIVGFDNIDASAWVSPPLTTVAQPIGDIAETAVNALHTLITDPGRELPTFLFRPRLVVRESTGPPAGGRP
jgi:DNA-binding LacI/PurR family transcriptional regulator